MKIEIDLNLIEAWDEVSIAKCVQEIVRGEIITATRKLLRDDARFKKSVKIALDKALDGAIGGR